jgi:hypothetical protein
VVDAEGPRHDALLPEGEDEHAAQPLERPVEPVLLPTEREEAEPPLDGDEEADE